MFSYVGRGIHPGLGFIAGWAIVFVVVNTAISRLGVGSLKILNRVFLAIELVLFFVGQIGLISSLVNFGAIIFGVNVFRGRGVPALSQ